jgi:hypothetical protein
MGICYGRRSDAYRVLLPLLLILKDLRVRRRYSKCETARRIIYKDGEPRVDEEIK